MKILIVDDESLAREILRKQLEKLGCREVFEAGDGRQALRLLEQEQPELVFLDICMPEMSGIQLMEQAAQMPGQPVFIILSGHERFEYAQRTMQLGANNYLLKPVADSKLQEALDTAARKIALQKDQKEQYRRLNRSISQKQDTITRQYLYDLLTGNQAPREFYQQNRAGRPVTFGKAGFQICLLTFKSTGFNAGPVKPQDLEILEFSFQNIAAEIAALRGVDPYFFHDGRYIGAILNFDGEAAENARFYQQLFQEIQGFVDRFSRIEVTIGVGAEVYQIDNIQEAYSTAGEAINQKLIKGEGRVFYYQNHPSHRPEPTGKLISVEEELVKSLYIGNEGEVAKQIKALYLPYRQAEQIDVKKLNKQHLNIFIRLHRELEAHEINASKVLEDEFLLYNKIQLLDSIDAMEQFLFDKVRLCISALQQQDGAANKKIMIRAKAFIRENIGRNLTLERAAEHVNFSAVYFSKFFKNEEGMTFIDYVTRVRIDMAKQLLKQNIKTSEICREIGFQDVKHFYKVFKKLEGITPGQYKKGNSLK